MEQLVVPSSQNDLSTINPEQIFKQIQIFSFTDKYRLYTCRGVKPLVGTCCVHKIAKYKEASSYIHIPSDQNFMMYSPPGSQEEELIIYDEKDIIDDIINVANIPIVTSIETQTVLVGSNEEDYAIAFVDVPLEAPSPTPFVNLVASAIKSITLKTLKPSAPLKQTSEPYQIPQSSSYEDVVSLKPEVLRNMSQNRDAIHNRVEKHMKPFSSLTTTNDAVRPEISSVLRTPCIYHVDTETKSSESSSTKKAGSLQPGTHKYQKSLKIRTYRNPDGSVTEEKKIVERSSTLKKGNLNDLYTSDEDDTKFDDKYFESLFKNAPNELLEDDLDFLVNTKNKTNGVSISRQTKSEKLNTKVVSSEAENVSNENDSSIDYAHSDIKRNHPIKRSSEEIEKEMQSKVIDLILKKSSDEALISRKSKSESINSSAPMSGPQLKISISGQVVSSKAENSNYIDNSVVSYVHSDIKRKRPVKQISKESEKKNQSEFIDQFSKTSSIATTNSMPASKKQNVVTRSTSADAKMLRNEATNTDTKFEKLNMKDIAYNTNLKKKIREEFNKVLTKIGKKPNDKDYDNFSKEMYDKYGIQLNKMQDNTGDSEKPLEQKVNKIEEIESKALKGSEKEKEILQEILNRLKLKNKEIINEKIHSKEENISKIVRKSNNATLSVKESLEQLSKKPLNTPESNKEGMKKILSRESLRFFLEIEKDGNYEMNQPDNIKVTDTETIRRVKTYKEASKRGDVKTQGIKILDSDQSENLVIKAAIEMFNKHPIKICDSEDDPKGVVQSAVNKFNKEPRRPENMVKNKARKLDDTKTTYDEKQNKPKEGKPTFVIKEIEIVDKQIPTKMALESTVQRELRAFRSSHPDKITTDSDVTSKSEGIIKEQLITADNDKKEVTMLNDIMTAHEENLNEKVKRVRSESDKKSVSIPESEFSSESHLKTKITRIKEKGRPDKFELHSVYKEVSTSSQVSEISKLPSKQSSSTRRDDSVSATKQEEGKVDTTSAVKNIKIESDERARKIIICKKCLMALCGFIPSKIVEETEVSADCQLCRLKEKQKVALSKSNSSDTTEETPSFSHSSNRKGQACVPPVSPSIKCYGEDTWSETYPCGRPKEDQKLVLFRDGFCNEPEQGVIDDDVTKFDMISSPSASAPPIPDKPTVFNAQTEPSVATVPTVVTGPTVATIPTEQNFAEMVAKSLIRLLGIEQKKQTSEMLSSRESVEMYESCESETFDVPCSTKICTREAATNTKPSSRYDVRCLRDLPPFKKGLAKRDTENKKCVTSDITVEIARMRDLHMKSVSSSSLDNTCNRNKNTSTKTKNSKYICKKKENKRMT